MRNHKIKTFEEFLTESIVTNEEREFIAFIDEYGEDAIREDVDKFIEVAKSKGFSDEALQNAREVYTPIDESEQFPNEIKSETFWRQILKGDTFALKILDTIMKAQKGFASDRQMEVLNRAKTGNKAPYHTKN